MRFVVLVKDNPVLQGQNSEKQSYHFVVKIHMLSVFKKRCIGESRLFNMIMSKKVFQTMLNVG